MTVEITPHSESFVRFCVNLPIPSRENPSLDDVHRAGRSLLTRAKEMGFTHSLRPVMPERIKEDPICGWALVEEVNTGFCFRYICAFDPLEGKKVAFVDSVMAK
jgi:hypothetical protein